MFVSSRKSFSFSVLLYLLYYTSLCVSNSNCHYLVNRYKDAIFCSPHKFVGGPGTPGWLVVLICLILKLLFDFKLLFFCFSYFPCFFLLTFHYCLFISYLPICLCFVLFCSSGCLIAKKKVFRNPVPGGCGGGTVVFVSNKDHDRPSHNQRYIT